MDFKGKRKEPRGIMLVDWENLIINIDIDGVMEAPVIGGFDRIIKEIAREAGEIVEVFVFLPPQPAYIWGETIHKLGFFPVVCPKVRSKDGKEEQDTVDATLIQLGKRSIDNVKDLSFLCLVSGDKDFSPLIRQVMRRGLKIIVVAASVRSLAGELIDLADKTYLFEPVRAG